MISSRDDLAKYGIIRDRSPQELTPEAWSDGKNFKFVDGYARKCDGYASVFGTPSAAPYALLPVQQALNNYWLYMGLQKVYSYDGGTHTNITRQTASVDVNYTGVGDNLWTGTAMGGVAVLTNGIDPPQMWLPSTPSTKLATLSNWPAGYKAKILRSYRSYLVAMGIDTGVNNFPTLLKWSHPADPGTVPVSWDVTDATKDAGEYIFADDGDFLIDCVQLRDTNIVYRENSVWSMQFIGGIDVFRFSRIFGNFGALSSNCAAEYENGKHIVLTRDDVMMHDGQSSQSILSGRWKRWLRANLNVDKAKQCFVAVNPVEEEVLICICTTSTTFPDKALVWNWVTGAIGERDLPLVSAIGVGIVNDTSVSSTWATDTEAWSSDVTTWGTRLYSASAKSQLWAVPSLPKFYKIDGSSGFDGVAMTAYAERQGLSFPFAQGKLPDFTSMKFMRALWPRITGTLGGTVNVAIGTQMEIGGMVKWKASKPYIIGTTKKINTTATGRLFALRFSSSSNISWQIQGYDVDVDGSGVF